MQHPSAAAKEGRKLKLLQQGSLFRFSVFLAKKLGELIPAFFATSLELLLRRLRRPRFQYETATHQPLCMSVCTLLDWMRTFCNTREVFTFHKSTLFAFLFICFRHDCIKSNSFLPEVHSRLQSNLESLFNDLRLGNLRRERRGETLSLREDGQTKIPHKASENGLK